MRKTILALLKIRLPMDEIREMTSFEAIDYLDAWSELSEPKDSKKSKKYLVLRKPKEGSGKQEAGTMEAEPSAAPKMRQPEGK